MQQKDKTDPSSTSSAFDAMFPKWELINTLLGGTEGMRAASDVYLPRHAEETNDGYEERLNAAVLLNLLDQTLNTLVGKPFKEGLKIGEDVPERIVNDVLPDVDLQGNSMEIFCRNWFEEGLAKAFSHVLIDFPRPTPREDGKPRTIADDTKEKLRPYWVHIKPESVIFAKSTVINGAEVLTHVRIMEEIIEMDGFVEKIEQRIRVLEPGAVTIYRPIEEKGKTKWIFEDSWTTQLPYIPLVTFYANKKGLMYGKPPLLDLAHLNVAHWQSSSDQRHILTVSRFPILACSGASEEDSSPIVVGPNKVLYNPDPSGRFYYVEHTGSAISAGREDLKDLEEQMSSYGAEFLKHKPGGETATARALDSSESSSDLASMVIVFEDAVAQALDITAEWLRLNVPGGTIELTKEFDLGAEDAPGLDTLTKARAARDISRKTYLEALRQRDILPEDFDPELNEEELLEETTNLLGEAQANLDAAQTLADKIPPTNPGEKTSVS